MPDLLTISRYALQTKQGYKRLEPRIGSCRAICLSAHALSPGLDVASNVRLREHGLLGRRLINDRRRTLATTRCDEARCHELTQQRSGM